MANDLAERLRLAYQARSALHEDPQTTAYRLFHGYGEGGPALAVDRFGDVAIIENRGSTAEEVDIAMQVLGKAEPFSCIVLKERGKEPRALLGVLPSEPSAVLEEGLSYWVETWAPRNPGLYLDARPARNWLRANSSGRRVLNLFSYAGSLGVAAMAGGAKGVIHCDTQKRALLRCQENHRLNGQRTDARDQERMDVVKMLRKASEKGRKFGGVIVDPPPPSASTASNCSAMTPTSLAPAISPLVEPGGWVLCFFHHDARSWDELEEEMGKALGRRAVSMWRGRSGSDFPESSAERDLRLSALRIA
ncbi:MAG: hypothetical protein GY811_24440 [Myxococcales bacterium]|nr:hypothetical protein [Myxococcales bacterium]